jgi:uncharacterized membrane protein YeiH
MIDQFLWLLDTLGCVAFGLSGALAAKKKQMDFFGLFLLASVTTFGGGLLRDMLLNIKPSAIFETPRYIITALFSAVVVWYFDHHVEKNTRMVEVFDSIGLAVFSAFGSLRAIEAGAPVYGVLIMAMITGCGGGIIRDLLRGEPPMILYGDFYATATVLGSGILQLMLWQNFPLSVAVVSCIVVVFSIRITIIIKSWRLKPWAHRS